MPLYEYECEACGHRFEVIQKFSDPPVDKCPACGSSVHKLQSAPAFQFKGTGWYVTDYAKSGAASDPKGGKEGGKAGKTADAASGTAETGKSGDKSTSSETSSTSADSTATPAAAKTETPKPK